MTLDADVQGGCGGMVSVSGTAFGFCLTGVLLPEITQG